MKTKNETVSLAFNDIERGGSSDKVYHLSLEKRGCGFVVTAQYGRRGSALATDNKTKNGAIPYADAKQLFDRVAREKRAKGYVDTGAKAPVVLPVPELGAAVDKPHAQELLEEITHESVLRHVLGSDDYWMQDKSDGHARGVVKTGGHIYGLNKLGGRVPLSAGLSHQLSLVPFKAFQIDAELVGERLVCRDLLVADRDIAELPYVERFKLLVRAVQNLSLVSVVETWEGAANKRAALEQSRAQRREGVVFKLKHARHRPGRNGQHKKFKFVKTCSVIAGKPRATGKDSVEIFMFDAPWSGKSKKIRVGTVSLIGKVQIKEGDVLEVRYLYAFPSKKLCQARFDRVRVDVGPGECATDQLIYKREDEGQARGGRQGGAR